MTAATNSDSLPKGSIILWSGTPDGIPTGWEICDGSSGRPDLRNRFPIGASDDHSVNSHGGSDTATLSVDNLPPHAHGYQIFNARSDTWKGGGDASPGDSTGNTTGNTTDSTGKAEPFSIVPRFWTVYFIIKTAG